MANSRDLQLNNVSSRVENILHEQIQKDDHLVLGLSGGLDSVVLLSILVPLSFKLKFKLTAFHVNHGISPNSNKWEKFCFDLCSRNNIPIEAAKLNIKKWFLSESLSIPGFLIFSLMMIRLLMKLF